MPLPEQVDWLPEDVQPDWYEIHQNVLRVARQEAARLAELRASLPQGFNSFGEEVASPPLSKIEFMRKVGFDERYIIFVNGWVDEQNALVSQLGSLFHDEIELSLDALEAAETHTDNTESE